MQLYLKYGFTDIFKQICTLSLEDIEKRQPDKFLLDVLEHEFDETDDDSKLTKIRRFVKVLKNQPHIDPSLIKICFRHLLQRNPSIIKDLFFDVYKMLRDDPIIISLRIDAVDLYNSLTKEQKELHFENLTLEERFRIKRINAVDSNEEFENLLAVIKAGNEDAAAILLLQRKKIKKMNNQTIQKIYVIGISTRTTNENGQSAKDIEALWGRFWGEKIQNQIPDKVSDEIYAIYTDYETDFTGPYTTIIGLPVNSLENIPKGFVGMTIETAVYQKFVSKGKMPDAVINTWLEIWGNKELNLKRAYKADFTVHGKKYYDEESAEVETFISLKD